MLWLDDISSGTRIVAECNPNALFSVVPIAHHVGVIYPTPEEAFCLISPDPHSVVEQHANALRGAELSARPDSGYGRFAALAREMVVTIDRYDLNGGDERGIERVGISYIGSES
jgi:hypothetical protein